MILNTDPGVHDDPEEDQVDPGFTKYADEEEFFDELQQQQQQQQQVEGGSAGEAGNGVDLPMAGDYQVRITDLNIT